MDAVSSCGGGRRLVAVVDPAAARKGDGTGRTAGRGAGHPALAPGRGRTVPGDPAAGGLLGAGGAAGRRRTNTSGAAPRSRRRGPAATGEVRAEPVLQATNAIRDRGSQREVEALLAGIAAAGPHRPGRQAADRGKAGALAVGPGRAASVRLLPISGQPDRAPDAGVADWAGRPRGPAPSTPLGGRG